MVLQGRFCKAGALALGVALLAATPVWAQFQLCNQMLDLANVAIGQPAGDSFETRGWWKICPNHCATLIRKPIAARFLYFFATDIFGKELLSGTVPMCIAPDRFVIEGESDCALRGQVEARFIEVDTGDTADWTLFLRAQP
ncbi:putative membrane protein [Rhodobacter viridis]|uniref:Putative membrane protein n=2 Tax=Rhodobacter viridis TaxID=1054202 RepID=A0A318U5Y3_9RHOB|nr:putative membrane protein [Rhodobacter viridis]